jgi:hypothetical protein
MASRVAKSAIKRTVARTIVGTSLRAAGMSGLRIAASSSAVGVVVIGALVAARLISGKPFEGMGLEVEAMLLGEQPQEAIAKRKTREQFQQNEAAMQIAGRYGITDQMRQVGEKLYHLNLAEEVGKNKIDRMFPQNGIFDLIILRMRNLFVGAWESRGIPAKIAQVRETLEEGQMRSIPRIYK